MLNRSNRHRQRILWAVALIVGLSGCFATSRRFDKPQGQPATSDVAGTYGLDDATLKSMREEGGYSNLLDTKLVLRPDGTAEMTNMPDWWGRFGGSNKGYFSGLGQWKVDRDVGSGQWVLFLFMPNEYQSLDLKGSMPPYKIFTFVGDPDSGMSMTFVKIAEASN